MIGAGCDEGGLDPASGRSRAKDKGKIGNRVLN